MLDKTKSIIKSMRLRHKPVAFLIVISLTALLLPSCGKKDVEPHGLYITGIREHIDRILVSPLAFDGAVVVVEGIVRELVETIDKEDGKENGTVNSINFKISDIRGAYINVSHTEPWPIDDNYYIVIGGKYRRITNTIEADQFEVIATDVELSQHLKKKKKAAKRNYPMSD